MGREDGEVGSGGDFGMRDAGALYTLARYQITYITRTPQESANIVHLPNINIHKKAIN